MTRGARERTKASAVSIVFVLLGFPLVSFRMPGAGFFPLLLGITLSVFSIMLLGMSLLSPAGRSTHVGPERPEVLYLVGSIVAAVWLFERAGFLVTMVLFAGVAMKVLGKMSW